MGVLFLEGRRVPSSSFGLRTPSPIPGVRMDPIGVLKSDSPSEKERTFFAAANRRTNNIFPLLGERGDRKAVGEGSFPRRQFCEYACEGIEPTKGVLNESG